MQFILGFAVMSLLFTLFFESRANENAHIVEGIGASNHRWMFMLVAVTSSMFICFIIGLPIRLIDRVRTWWIGKPLINLVLLLTGLILLFCNSLPFFNQTSFRTDYGELTTYSVTDPRVVVAGWLLTCFSLLHFYPDSIVKFKRKQL